ncbi:collagenase [Pseudoduganella sp. RAF19]|uniref:collagenase n=3 Tax=unclassified Pseudoduganella TaxID=2637179 RepID=UPI003F957B7F
MRAAAAVPDCAADLNTTLKLSGAELVTRISSLNASCMDSRHQFFEINPATLGFYSNQNMLSVAEALRQQAPAYTPDNPGGVRQMLIYLRAGEYVAWFSEGALVFDSQTRSAVENALLTFSANAYFTDASPQHSLVMWDYLVAADGADRNATLLPTGIRYLEGVMSNSSRSEEQYKAVSNFFEWVARRANNGDADWIQIVGANATQYEGLLFRAATFMSEPITEMTGTSKRLAYNSALAYANLLRYPSTRDLMREHLQDLLGHYERFSGPFMAVASTVDFLGVDCSPYGLCRQALEPELRALAFPNTYTFDDGKLVMQTAVDLPKARQLYLAIKQVKAQYVRKTGFATPLADDTNDVLTMRIYGTRAAYEDWQWYLEGLDTDNGGIYIERGATFYTYERTAAESTLTLEELLRHEYTHYLEGRYTEHGTFGDTIYDGNRLTWFDEGAAEFFAGATQASGIKLRRATLNKIRNDAERMSVSQFVGASYDSGFNFYYYSSVFFAFLDEQRPLQFRALFSTLRSGDIAAFDDLVRTFKADPLVQRDYDSYLDRQLAAFGTVPEFQNGEQFDPATYALGTPEEVQSSLRTFFPAVNCVLAFQTMDARAGCTGTLDKQLADKTVDSAIKAAVATGLNNWRTFVCNYDLSVVGPSIPYYCEVGVRGVGVPFQDIPVAPHSVVATPGDKSATINFVPGLDAFGQNVTTMYTVMASPGGANASGLGTSLIVKGLENGTAYTFSVVATRSGLASLASSPSNSVTPTAPAPLLASSQSGASGIGAWFEVVSGGINIRWINPVHGSYSLELDNGAQSLYYGGHFIDHAPVLFDAFHLTGAEMLVGRFMEYDDQQHFVREHEAFRIDLSLLSVGKLPAPRVVAVRAADRRAFVDFAPVDGAESYTAVVNPGGRTVSGTASSILIPALTNGTSYSITLFATRGGKNGLVSSQVTVKPQSIPALPTSFGIQAWVELVRDGFAIRWRNPVGGQYKLNLDSGSQSLYAGQHDIDGAKVNYSQFHFTGQEILTGHFILNNADGRFVRDYAPFVMDLTGLMPFGSGSGNTTPPGRPPLANPLQQPRP